MFWILIKLPVPGREGLFVGADGSLWSNRRFSIMRKRKPYFDKTKAGSGRRGVGYMTFSENVGDGRVKKFLLHRCVLAAFRGGDKPGMACRHLDGNPCNNAITNLAWGTHIDNMADKVAHGKSSVGETNPGAKLTVRDVLSIRASKDPTVELAKRFSVTTTTIRNVRNGASWKHLLGQSGPGA